MAQPISVESITDYVEKNIPDFHQARLASIQKLKMVKVLSRKNPYLLKAKGIGTPGELVRAVLDAHLSSQEETLLGGFLENLAIFLCQKAYKAHGKSTSEGIDLEFKLRGTRYLIAIKSGPNWGNSSQIRKMEDNFKQAKKIYRQSKDGLNIECVNGCCYGKQSPENEDNGAYRKLCGQSFWEFITGDPDIYKRIVQPIGHQAKERNDSFRARYEKVVEEFTQQFRSEFCDTNSSIDWDRLVNFISGRPTITPVKLNKPKVRNKLIKRPKRYT